MKKVVLSILVLSSSVIFAREKAGVERTPSSSTSENLGGKIMANCAAPKASQELKINNVRTIIYTGGDMWWNLFGDGNARYIIPKTEKLSQGISSSFAGSIWLGGLDAGGSLKVAAMTYRQNGIDFWPGPLDTITATADADMCLKYDQLYSMTRAEVDAWVGKTGPLTTAMTNWPGNGDIFKGQGFYLAPYFRFRTLGFGSDITFLDSNKISRLATLDGKITTFAGGLMIGSHFKIGKQFSLDWFILGAHFGSNKGKIAMTVQGSNMTVADQIKLKNDLQQTFDDSKIFKNNTVTTTANSAEVTTTFGMLGLRGFGLNFGYRF